MNGSKLRVGGFAVALLATSTAAQLLVAMPARATFPASVNGPIVFESTYVSPCVSGTCRHATAPHPGGSLNLWVVDPTSVSSTGASSASDPAATRQLTDTEGTDGSAAWSSDGATVVFDRDTTGSPQIYAVTRANAPAAEDDDPGLAAGATAADGARRLSSDGSDDIDPSFSPDGHTIAFVQDLSAVVTLDLAHPGGPETTLFGGSLHAVNDSRPVFDPVDQSQLVFVNGSGHLVLITGIGTAAQASHDLSAASGLTLGVDEWPDWAPDGSAIVFDSTRPVTGSSTNTQQLWTMTFTASGSTTTAQASPVFVNAASTGTLTGFKDTQPVFSPDGKQLAWSRVTGSGDVDAEMLRMQSGRHLLATDAPMDLTLSTANPTDRRPSWTASSAAAPDRQTIVVTVSPGSLIVSTPYTPSNPFKLGTAVLNPSGTQLNAAAPFGTATDPNSDISISDTRAGNVNWTASVASTPFTDPASDTISQSGLSLTAVHALSISGNALTSANVSVNDIAQLSSSPQAFAHSTAGGDGSIYVYGALGLTAPTSTKAGTYTATMTFTLA